MDLVTSVAVRELDNKFFLGISKTMDKYNGSYSLIRTGTA